MKDQIVTTIPEGGSVADLIGEPPEPKDALRYACLDVGYSHRPVPIGSTKRRSFCRVCEARRCYFHPEMTPAEVRKRKVIPSMYPARRITNYVRGR